MISFQKRSIRGWPRPCGGIAPFSYSDSTGKVSYVGSVASQGKATCWLNISPDGKYLCGTDSASDAISVYSLTNPLKAVMKFFASPKRAHEGGAVPPSSAGTAADGSATVPVIIVVIVVVVMVVTKEKTSGGCDRAGGKQECDNE